MARKVIECRTLIPASMCTMLFVGEADDVKKAFTEHATSAHQHSALAQSVEDALQSAVFIGSSRAYVGETIVELDSGAIRVPGPGFLIRRFDEDAGTDGAGAAGLTLDCSCVGGTGSCTLLVHDSTARCHNNTCTTCGFVVTAPTVVGPNMILRADWLVDPVDPPYQAG